MPSRADILAATPKCAAPTKRRGRFGIPRVGACGIPLRWDHTHGLWACPRCHVAVSMQVAALTARA